MSDSARQPYRRAQHTYYLHNALNMVSLTFLSGSIITLYALRLNAGNSLIGLFASINSSAFLFSLVGRVLVRRVGAVRLYGTCWTIRYFMMVAAVLTIIPGIINTPNLAFVLIAAGLAGFHIAKGVGIAGVRPIIGEITTDRDRGRFLSTRMLIMYSMSIISRIFLGSALGRDAPLHLYPIFFIAGIGIGLVGSALLFRIPEPQRATKGFAFPLGSSLRKLMQDRGSRLLLSLVFFRIVLISMVTPFLVVYFKNIYGLPDRHIVFITVAGGLGSVAMAMISSLIIDRVGSKPLLFTFAVVTSIVLLPVAMAPSIQNPVLIWIFPMLIYFFYHLGMSGTVNSHSAYFYSSTIAVDRLNYGVIFNLARGTGGFVGALLGGFTLDLLGNLTSLTQINVFRLYFAVLFCLFAGFTILVIRLPDIGAYTIQDAMGIFFSPREMKALTLLRRLDRSRNIREEGEAIETFSRIPSVLLKEELLRKISSPSLFIRREAYRALRNHPVDRRIRKVLFTALENSEAATAALAAKAIGEHGLKPGVPLLKQALRSDDEELQGQCMLALARLVDLSSVRLIAATVEATDSPGLIITGAKALEILRAPQAVPLLLDKLRSETPSYLRDEIILILAGVLECFDWFYPIYRSFHDDKQEGLDALSAYAIGSTDLTDLINAVPSGGKSFQDLSDQLLAQVRLRVAGTDVTGSMREAGSDPELSGKPHIRFFIAAVIVRSHSGPDRSLS